MHWPDGTIKKIDPQCAECWEKDDFVGKNWMSFLDSRCNGTNAKDLMRFLNTKKTPVLCSRWFNHPTKGSALLRSLLVPILDENNEVTEIIVSDQLLHPSAINCDP